MDTFAAHQYALLQETLSEIEIASENKLQLAERSYHAAQDSLQRIKDFILEYSFKDQQEEIRFFKEIKPMFLRELIYYLKIFYLEAGKPLGDKDVLTAYYKQAIDLVNNFFERNYMLYIYYRMGKSDQDQHYFVRSAANHQLLPEYSLDIDPKFSTIYSYKFAKIQAYERLNEYLLSEIHAINSPSTLPDQGAMKTRPDTTWTDPKVDLIELAYAIYSRGSVNHGKTEVKQVISALEYAFNITLGHFYAVFQQNIRIRKKSRTVYLDQLKDHLERRMDDWDELPPIKKSIT